MREMQKTEIGGMPLYTEPEKLDQHLGHGVHAVQPNLKGKTKTKITVFSEYRYQQDNSLF